MNTKTILKKGSQGSEVKLLQQYLGFAQDGVFGAGTAAAVVAFQAMHHLEADGIVGEKTWAALEAAYTPATAKPKIVKMPITEHITKKKGRPITYIVVHYTAGGSSKAGMAAKTRDVFVKRAASADFCVDDNTIVQVNPDLKNYYTWAVGDGGGKYGVFNTNSISIEMCSTLQAGTSSSKPNHSGWSVSEAVQKRTIELIRYLMQEYNVPISRVIRHYDASRKACPGLLGWNDGEVYDAATGNKTKFKNNSSKWEAFKKRIQGPK